MGTWITRIDEKGAGPRVAVKDAFDVAGVPTTVGCRAVADSQGPAAADAACLAGARAAGAPIVGKTNLHELCFGTSGINPWFGTPVNPLDPARVPGGSSSGSAVAVATGEADVGLGTDTGGSVRIPAACCGVVGLKTTWGRVSLGGVWPLSPTFDTVGPLGRSVADVVAGMALLEPGFVAADTAAATVGRVRVGGVDPAVDAAVDEALARTELEVVDVELALWAAAQGAFGAILLTEAAATVGPIAESRPASVGDDVRERLTLASWFDADAVAAARAQLRAFREELTECFDRVQLLALPTLDAFPPLLVDPPLLNRLTAPFNVAQTPALSLPVPVGRGRGSLPASLQLVGPWDGEALLCATGARVEAAVGGRM
ncbi:MAG TPA: amidase [Acidimicrobiales bacterium]|nr:amidase [Acidimicrobiales bacterium]